jgi:hypothetical protein
MSEQQHATDTPAAEAEPAESQTTPPSGPVASGETSADQEPLALERPEANEEPAAEANHSPDLQDAANAETGQKVTLKSLGSLSQAARNVAGFFTACPRCSFFLAGYRLIFQDFDQAARNASDDWLDLSWNLAVRNLVAKSYGYDMNEPFEAFQGVCPVCRRAFSIDTGDDRAEEARFSIQINPRD